MAALRMAKQLIVPSALKPGGTIAVTAPSAGVAKALEPRFEVSERFAERAGYVVRRGRCLFSDDHVSASVADRATELQEMLIDETVGAVIPPWGGELLLPVLEHLDFERIRANPRWFAGWSDCSAVTFTLLLRSGLMSLHGQNFMDLPMAPAAGGTSWQTILGGTQGDSFTDNAQDAFASKWPDYRADPEVLSFPVDTPTTWKVLGPDREIEATGRLVGGCNEIVSRLAGTPFGDLDSFANTYAPEGLIIYLENAESNAFEVARTLHGADRTLLGSKYRLFHPRGRRRRRPRLSCHPRVLQRRHRSRSSATIDREWGIRYRSLRSQTEVDHATSCVKYVCILLSPSELEGSGKERPSTRLHHVSFRNCLANIFAQVVVLVCALSVCGLFHAGGPHLRFASSPVSESLTDRQAGSVTHARAMTRSARARATGRFDAAKTV
jgi:muramoyltetrapeptide carboxypeptidase